MHLIFKAGKPEIQSKVNESGNLGLCPFFKVIPEGKDEEKKVIGTEGYIPYLSEQIVHRHYFSGYGPSAQEDKKQ